MGCCLSKRNPQNQNQNPHHRNSLKTQQPHLKSNPTHVLAPPQQPPFEEESVKEVLSETPISKPHQVPILIPETKTQMPLVQNPAKDSETKDPNPIIKAEEEVSELVSQISEACSISESFSTANTGITTEKREEDEATSERSNRDRIATTTHKWNRSPSNASSRKGPYAVNGNVAVGRGGRPKSPAKRSEPSPEKKVQSGRRPVRGRESGPVANRKINVGVQRDSGEGSGRRSRSPSCNGKGGGTTMVCSEGGRKQVTPAKDVVEKEKSDGEEKNEVVTPEESLENPHVSMECFIFL
ncbi:hypothetical protein TanjilG_11722 [Lupinus angustifolius]|uniref:Uncharacterized protein n=1 Tax=Lupinus angustifolius TaxID=3871 RepID=A0A1J7HZP6_LUPAN|nr:PREDICTED: uncharacterized protein LOC109353444 [Lupinus angustifolius]OIW06035.1 hypothetical protein TanjilG_11722 [Lupinus angustifolius]